MRGRLKKLSIELHHLMIPIALVCLILLVVFRGNSVLQFEILAIAAVSYVSLALLHHHFDKSLTLETIIEYILIAILALVVLQGLVV